MKTRHLLLWGITFGLNTIQINAQTDPVINPVLSDTTEALPTVKSNIFKVNLTSIPLKNYSFQFERVLNKKISVAIGFRTMPSTTIPFKNQILKLIGDDPDAEDILNNSRLSNIAITPELRIYLGKGYGKGFYIAPFYRYANYKTNQLTVTFENSLGQQTDIQLSGKLTSNTGGLMFGSQWNLGKLIILDWWILGPHYGSGTGNFSGVSSRTLTQDEQNDLKQELEDLDIPFTDKTVMVNANGASVKMEGPWGGIRSGILLGVRF